MRLMSEEGGSGRKLIEKKKVNSKGTALQLLCREMCHYEKKRSFVRKKYKRDGELFYVYDSVMNSSAYITN